MTNKATPEERQLAEDIDMILSCGNPQSAFGYDRVGLLIRGHSAARVERLQAALKDAISTYDPKRAETFVSAERQEAWAAALESDSGIPFRPITDNQTP